MRELEPEVAKWSPFLPDSFASSEMIKEKTSFTLSSKRMSVYMCFVAKTPGPCKRM